MNNDEDLDFGAVLEGAEFEEDDDAEEEADPTLTFKVENGRIRSKCDDFEAMVQATDKILKTERFVYPIYDDQYGNDLPELFGESFDYAETESEQMIIDALMEDDRVTEVEIEELTRINKHTLQVKGVCNTIYGDVNIDEEVEVDNDTE
ncbi:DUF2634 domain-containing protein [Lactobacillus sp. PSON]|uniref:DUF2634 domain-containing protein n=1 Tax=Lactobacillus sp. PSON TaxID=3455454 RepID=UPI004041BB02